MTSWPIEYIVTGVLIGPVAVYLVARLTTAAFFKSKEQYERHQNGKR